MTLDAVSTGDERVRRLAVAVWFATFWVVMALRWAGLVRGISYDVYAAAGARWLAHQNLYDPSNIEGFQYLPSSALFFAPFALSSLKVGGFVWRALSWALLALGSWRLAQRSPAPERAWTLAAATAATVPVAIGALGNGQANLMLAAATLFVVVELQRERWWAVALWLGLGVALKPHLAVLALLVAALYRPVTWRLPIVLVTCLAAPFVFADPHYVLSQYGDFVTKLRAGGAPPPNYEDIRGLLATVGWVMPHGVAMSVRLLAAGVVLAAAHYDKRSSRRADRPLMLAALASWYLMLFSPRTQATTYVILAAVAAFFVAEAVKTGDRRRLLPLVAMQLAWVVNRHWLPAIELWLKPLAAVFFGAFLCVELTRRGSTREDVFQSNRL